MNMAESILQTLRGRWLMDEPMARHVSWRAGGRARRAYVAADLADLAAMLRAIPRTEPVLFVGLGSNLLVRDGGYPGTVVFTHGVLGDIRADERKFKQIVLNLLSNAVKFTPDGGSVEVDARMNGGSLNVSVKDTGVGMSEATCARVFEPFFTTKKAGTGLGLATVYGIVARAGGTVRALSAPGQGTTMLVSLPRSFG